MSNRIRRLAPAVVWMAAIWPLPADADNTSTSASVAAGELKALANIAGFRSAHFGMDEPAVRRAIERDFGVLEDKVRVDLHPVEKTTVLTVAVDRLLPDTPPAVVSYVFGFRTQKLIQVSVLWAAEKPDGLPEAALTLRNYFDRLQFQDGKSSTDGVLADGSRVVFRGIDRNGHAVLVNLQTPPAEKKPPGALNLLRVTYAERTENPDVYVLEPGKF